MAYRDREQQRRNASAWYLKNREQIQENYRVKREEILQKGRDAYEANLDAMRERARQYYWEHVEEKKAYAKEYKKQFNCENPGPYERLRDRKRLRLIEAKSKPCMDCGGMFPAECMDFDHVRGEKTTTVGALSNHSDKRFWAEVAKCDLICSNCHRIRTWKRGIVRKGKRIGRRDQTGMLQIEEPTATS